MAIEILFLNRHLLEQAHKSAAEAQSTLSQTLLTSISTTATRDGFDPFSTSQTILPMLKDDLIEIMLPALMVGAWEGFQQRFLGRLYSRIRANLLLSRCNIDHCMNCSSSLGRATSSIHLFTLCLCTNKKLSLMWSSSPQPKKDHDGHVGVLASHIHNSSTTAVLLVHVSSRTQVGFR